MTETTPAERSAVWRDDNLQPADRLAAIRKRHAVLAARTWEATPHQHGASGCRCLSCYDDPTGWQIDHPGALDCEELVADSLNDFGRKRGSCDAGPLLPYDEADALARAADDIGFLLDLAAATVPAAAPTDQTALRSDIEEALRGCGVYDPEEGIWRSLSAAWVEEIVPALLAVLPAPTDRAAILRELADEQTQLAVADDLERNRSQAAARRDLVRELRRLADAASGPGGAAGETQQDERPRCPHCRMPHDLTPDVAAVCASIRATIAADEAQQPECSASRSGDCLREAESETACDTEAGECVHGGKPGGEAQQDETQADDEGLRAKVDDATSTLRRIRTALRTLKEQGATGQTYHQVITNALAGPRPDEAPEPETEADIVREHVTTVHLIGEQLADVESWLWKRLAEVRAEQPAAVSQPGKEAYTVCLCGHSRGEHIAVSDRLLCDTCDPDSTDNRTCDGFEEL